MERLAFYNTPIMGSYSLPKLGEGSVIISEAEEINEVKSLQEQGNRATSVQDYTEAVTLYNEALEIDAKNPSVLAARAFAYIEIGNYTDALHDAETAYALEPQNSEVNCALGFALHHIGQSMDGLKCLLFGLDLELDNADKIANYIVTVVTHICSVTEEAADSLREMDSYKKLTEVGVLLCQAKKFESCIQVLEIAHKLQTKQKGITMRLLFTLANAQSKLRKTEDAIDSYMECYGMSVATHDTLYQTKSLVNIAMLYLESGDTYQAIIYYEKLHELELELITESDGDVDMPEFWTKELQCGLHLNLSIAYKNIGNMHSAVTHAKTYVSLLEKYGFAGKMYAESYHNTGLLNEILEQYPEALENFKKYLALSKKEGNRKGIAQAYGCLGSVYAALYNWQMAITYHEQHISIAKKTQDSKMLTIAYEMLGNTYMLKNDYEQAVRTFENMLNACIRTDYRNKASGLCKIGNAYRAQGKHQYSKYFYEQACDLANDFDYKDIQTVSQYNIACMNQNSTQMLEIEEARKYFLRLIPFYERKIQEHRQQGTYCPADYKHQLQECYDGVVNVLAKMGNKEECLEFAENCRKRCVTELPNFSVVPGQNTYVTSSSWDVWSLQRIERTLSGQNATVLYYSLLDSQLLLWVLQPAVGLARFYTGSVSKDTSIREKISKLIDQLFVGFESKNKLNENEARAVPLSDSHLKSIRLKNQKLSKSASELFQEKSVVDDDNDNTDNKKRSVERQLYDILLSPIEDILSKLDRHSNIIIIPDKLLHHCPFGILQNWTLVPLAQRFRISYLPCLLLLDRVIRNEIEALRLQDELQFERSQSRCGGVSKLLKLRSTGSPYSETPDLSGEENVIVNLKSVSNPRLLTSQGSMVVEQGKSSLGFLQSRENTFLTMTSNTGNSELRCGAGSPTTTVGKPAPPEKVLSTHTFTTLASQTATGTDIVQSTHSVTQFVQLSNPERCLVIGAPKLNKRLKFGDKEWTPYGELTSAERELRTISEYLGITAVLGHEATKDRFIKEIQTATIIHIATYGCLEKGLLVFTPNSINSEEGCISEESYLVAPEDILNLKLQAQLVVLNVGFTPHRRQYLGSGFILPSIFLAAGAQCVLINQWQVPDTVMELFYKEFYTMLLKSCSLSQALNMAVQTLSKDERCSHICSQCPYILIGKDIQVNITSIKHSMLNQLIDKIELEVEEGQEYLNLKSTLHQVLSPEENKSRLQKILVKLLTHCPHDVTVIYQLIELLDAALKRLHTEENNRMTSSLPTNIIHSKGGIDLLKFLGFHFQARGFELDEPYIVYPHWNLDSLLIPAYDGLRALTDLCYSERCCHMLSYLFPLTQNNISLLVDLLSITKHASDIQLNVSDMSVKPLWYNKQIQSLLTQIGFQQIGLVLNFKQTQVNRKLLTAILQLLLAISCHKSQVLLYRLDVSLLGHIASSKFGSKDMKSLPSLTPLMLPRNQLRMSTPWLSKAETITEMEEKMSLAKCKSDLDEEYEEHKQQAKSWHQISAEAQANEMLDKFGRVKTKPSKIKVMHGSGGLKTAVPIKKEVQMKNREIDQRRDYAHFIYKQRLSNIGNRHKNDVMKLYLPFIKSN